METPGGVRSYIRSEVNMGFPTNSWRFASSTLILLSPSLTILNATLRKIYSMKERMNFLPIDFHELFQYVFVNFVHHFHDNKL